MSEPDESTVMAWNEHSDHAADGYDPSQEEPPDDVCVDADNFVWPEHDFPAEDAGNECRRCGAEAEQPDETGGYSTEPPF